MKSIAIYILIFLSAPLIAQTTFTSVAGGNFNDGATWGNASPGVEGTDFPGASDRAVIIGASVTVNSNVACSDLHITMDDFGDGGLTIDAGKTLTVGDSVYVRTNAAGATINFTINGTLTYGGALNFRTTHTLAGAFVIGAGGLLNSTSTTKIDSISVKTATTALLTFTQSGRLVNLNRLCVRAENGNDVNWTIGDLASFKNLSLTADASGSTVTVDLQDSLQLSNTLLTNASNSAGASAITIDMNTPNCVLRLAGSFNIQGDSCTVDAGATQSTFEYYGTTQTIAICNTVEYHDLKISCSTNGNLQKNLANKHVLDDIVVASGKKFNFNSKTCFPTDDLNNAGTVTQNAALTIAATGDLINSGTFTQSAAITCNGNLQNSGTFNQNSGNSTVGKSLQNTAGTYTQTTGTITITKDLQHTGGTFNQNADITITDTLTNTATYNATAGTLTVSKKLKNTGGTFTQNTDVNVTVDLVNTGTYNATTGTLSITQDLKNTGGTFTNNSTTNVTLDLENSATFNHSSGTLTVSQDLLNTAGTFTQGSTLNVTRDFTHSGGTFNGQSTMDVNRNVTLSSACNGSTWLLNIAGNWTNTGQVYTNSATDVIEFDGTTGESLISGTTTWATLKANTSGASTGIQLFSGTHTIKYLLDINAGDFDMNGKTVILASDATSSGVLGELTGTLTINGGTFTLQRYIAMGASQDYVEMCTPITGKTLADWNTAQGASNIVMAGFTGSDSPTFWGGASVWTCKESKIDDNGDATSELWQQATNTTNAIGYDTAHHVYLDAKNYTIALSGTPNTGSKVINISHGGFTNSGWALVGNPYPCGVLWSSATLSGTVDNVKYTWNGDNDNYASFAPGFGGTNGGVDAIAHSQGYWVHCTAAGTITWDENDKTHSQVTYLKSTESNVYDDVVRIKLTNPNGSKYDEVLLKANEKGNNRFIEKEDHTSFFTNRPDISPTLAIRDQESNQFLNMSHISSLGPVNIQLYSKAATSVPGVHTLEFTIPENFMNGTCLILEDTYNGIMTDLRTTPAYTYNSSQSNNGYRFVLHLNTPYSTRYENPSCHSANDGKVIIEGSGINGTVFSLLDGNFNLIQQSTANYTGAVLENLPAGEYKLVSSFSGDCGSVDTTNIVIEEGIETIANFELSADSVDVFTNGTVNFNNFSQGSTFLWNFGDGATSTEYNPTHVYTEIGTYMVVLTVNDGLPCAQTVSQTVEVFNSHVGIEELMAEKIKVNVIDGQIVLNHDFETITRVDINLLDMTGKNISEISSKYLTTGTTVIGERLKLSEGIYLVQLSVNGEAMTYKIKI